MSALVKVSRDGHTRGFGWRCSEKRHEPRTGESGVTIARWYGSWTIHDAATDGMRHLAAHHTAQMPPVAHGDPDALKVAPGPHTARPGHDWDFPCCNDNPIQRTYDESRADA